MYLRFDSEGVIFFLLDPHVFDDLVHGITKNPRIINSACDPIVMYPASNVFNKENALF